MSERLKIDTGRKRIQLSASEAVFAFVGWLTTRDEVIKLGASENATEPCDLVKLFCEAHKLDEPRESFEYLMVNMSEWMIYSRSCQSQEEEK